MYLRGSQTCSHLASAEGGLTLPPELWVPVDGKSTDCCNTPAHQWLSSSSSDFQPIHRKPECRHTKLGTRVFTLVVTLRIEATQISNTEELNPSVSLIKNVHSFFIHRAIIYWYKKVFAIIAD